MLIRDNPIFFDIVIHSIFFLFVLLLKLSPCLQEIFHLFLKVLLFPLVGYGYLSSVIILLCFMEKLFYFSLDSFIFSLFHQIKHDTACSSSSGPIIYHHSALTFYFLSF